jgi:Restriction endonuclease fold toxin 5
MSDRSAAYQEQISGRPATWAYRVDGVDFDGYTDGTLIEAKGRGYATFIRNGEFPRFFEVRHRAERQSINQRDAARGLPIVWCVAEPETVEAFKRLHKNLEITDIAVIHVPPEG